MSRFGKRLKIFGAVLLAMGAVGGIVGFRLIDRFATGMILSALQQPRVTSDQLHHGGWKTSPQELGLQGEEVFVTSADGSPQRAWWIPARTPNAPVVVLLHGFGVRGETMLTTARGMHAKGYAALCPDNRGFGESAGIPTFGIRESEDLAAFMAWIGNRYFQPPPVALFGGSYGAALALGLSVKTPNVKCVIAMAPYSDLSPLLDDRFKEVIGNRRIPFLKGFAVTRFLRVIDASSLDDVSPLHLLESAAFVPPILLFHGTEDRVIPVSQSRDLKSRFPAKVDYHEAPGAGHEDLFEEGFLRAADAFLAAHLKR